MNYNWIVHTWRCSCRETWDDLWLLSGSIPGHHLQDPHQAEDSLLLLQSHHSLCSHRFHGCARLHSSLWLWRKTLSWWVENIKNSKLWRRKANSQNHQSLPRLHVFSPWHLNRRNVHFSKYWSGNSSDSVSALSVKSQFYIS